PPHQCLHPFPTRRSSDLVQSALANTWGTADGELDTPTARWLYRTMRAAELAGADPAAIVMGAVQIRDMDGARDIPAVIDARMRRDRKSTRLNSSHLVTSY